MSVAIRLLDSFSSTSNSTSYNSGNSYTPAINSQLFLFIFADGYVGAGPSVVLGGLSASMTSEGSSVYNAGVDTAFLYTLQVGGTTASTGILITFGAAATGINYAIFEVTGSDLTASPLALQSVFNTSAGSSNPTGTFSSPVRRDSALLAGFGISGGTPASWGAPPLWALDISVGHILPGAAMSIAHRAGGEVGTQTFAFQAGGSNPWVFIGVEVAAAIRITAQPTQQTAAPAGSATFSATATGSSLTYQWQVAPITNLYAAVPGTWADISGETSNSLTLSSVSAADNGKWYRLRVMDGVDTTYTETARLFIKGQPVTGKGTALGPNGLGGWMFQHNMDRSYRSALLRKRQWPGDFDGTEATVWRDWYGMSQGGGFFSRYYYDMTSQHQLGS